MDLILWRHAEAQQGIPDFARVLTPRGHTQASAIAEWLRTRLPTNTTIWVSPATRAQQTAYALDRPFSTETRLQPSCSLPQLIDLVAEALPRHTPLLVVGHEPYISGAAAHWLGGDPDRCATETAGVWWLRWSEATTDEGTAVLHAEIAPSTLTA